MRNSRRGTYIVEAAVVLPVIIAAMITLVQIEGFFYQAAAETSRMHIALRSSAGALTGKTLYSDDGSWDGEMEMKKNATGGKVYGKSYVEILGRGMMVGRRQRVIEGTYYAVDGPKYVRYCSIVKGITADDAQ